MQDAERQQVEFYNQDAEKIKEMNREFQKAFNKSCSIASIRKPAHTKIEAQQFHQFKMDRYEANYIKIPASQKPTPMFIAFNQNDP